MEKEQLLYHYFSNALTPKQEQRLNELLATDTEFKQQFDFEKDLKRVIREKETNNLKDKLSGFEKDISKDTPVRTMPNTNYRKWAVAASIALIIGLGWLGYNNFAGPDYNALYQENFQNYPNTAYTITRSDTNETLERDAFVAYESGDFEKAADKLKTISKENPNYYLDFYLAMSYLNLNQFEKAKTYFTNTTSSKSEFVDEAYWYLALIALKQKDKESAKEYLSKLTATDAYNQERAKQLLEKLD